MFFWVVHLTGLFCRPLPTFLKNKKKRKTKPVVSDGSDVERTPPASPTDDSLVSYVPL